jgi:hypothetical protein
MFATMFAATHGLIIHRLTLIQVVGFIVLASLAFLWFILILTRPLATSFAGATVATVVQQIVADDLKLLTAGREPPWSEDEVWDVLQTVVCNQLAASRQQVTPQARFVEDLGMY